MLGDVGMGWLRAHAMAAEPISPWRHLPWGTLLRQMTGTAPINNLVLLAQGPGYLSNLRAYWRYKENLLKNRYTHQGVRPQQCGVL